MYNTPYAKPALTMTGIVYLVQPKQLIGTSRYKVGCSESPTLTRVQHGYLKGTRYLFIMECENPRALEQELLRQFAANFERIAGKEYFQGDENSMRLCFMNICLQVIRGAEKSSESESEAESDTTGTKTRDITKWVRWKGQKVAVIKHPDQHWIVDPSPPQTGLILPPLSRVEDVQYNHFMILHATGACKILDTRMMSLHDPEQFYDGVILDRSSYTFPVEILREECDAPEMLRILPNKDRNELRRFLYYVLVEEPSGSPNIFRGNTDLLLFIQKIKVQLCGHDGHHFAVVSAKCNEMKSVRAKHISTIRDYRVRVVVLIRGDGDSESSLQREVMFYSGLGVKNFVVMDNSGVPSETSKTEFDIINVLTWVSSWSA